MKEFINRVLILIFYILLFAIAISIFYGVGNIVLSLLPPKDGFDNNTFSIILSGFLETILLSFIVLGFGCLFISIPKVSLFQLLKQWGCNHNWKGNSAIRCCTKCNLKQREIWVGDMGGGCYEWVRRD